MDDVREDLRRMGVTNWRIQCTQKRRLQEGREGGQGPTGTVEPRSQVKLCWLCASNGNYVL
jgi:hypothetical protein